MINMINKIESKEGYVFALKDKSMIFNNIMILGICDSADNYIQIPIAEAEEIKRKQKEAHRREYEASLNKN